MRAKVKSASLIIVTIIIISCLTLVNHYTCCAQNIEMLNLSGDYFGEKSPGQSLKEFLPTLFSAQGLFNFHLHSSLYFTTDGKEVYFTNQKLPVKVRYDQTILFMKQIGGKWASPETAPFSGKYSDQIFHISPDGNRIYFTSTRPLNGDGDASNRRNGWIVERKESGWSAPVSITTPEDLKKNDGTIFVSANLQDSRGNADIYRLTYNTEHYSFPENIGNPVNTEHDDYACCYSKKGKFLIYYHFDNENKKNSSLFLSFLNEDNSWSKPVSLSEKWNLTFGFSASLSPDEKYLFILDRGQGIYWIEREAISGLRN